MDCIVCLSVFNNEFGLPFVLENISKLKQIFFKIQILVFYDHSKDNSLNILNQYKEKNENMEIIINNNEKSPSRTVNIANARNRLLEKIKEKYSNFPYFVMMDSNEYSCIGNINLEVLQKCLDRNNEWDAISFDREAGYYDTWALSFDPYIYSFFHFQNWNKVVDGMRTCFDNRLKDYKTNKKGEFMPVYSAFNGFAIYKTNKFINCSYSSNINIELFPLDIVRNEIEITNCNIINYFENDCEHRHFHLEAIQKNDAKIRICTDFLFSKFINPPKGLRGPA